MEPEPPGQERGASRSSRRAGRHLGPAHHVQEQEQELPVSNLSLKGWLLCGWTNPHKTSVHADISPSPSEG